MRKKLKSGERFLYVATGQIGQIIKTFWNSTHKCWESIAFLGGYKVSGVLAENVEVLR